MITATITSAPIPAITGPAGRSGQRGTTGHWPAPARPPRAVALSTRTADLAIEAGHPARYGPVRLPPAVPGWSHVCPEP